MSERFENRAALRGKIEWEGGIMEALEYGIKSADMPPGDEELDEAWGKLAAAYQALQPLADAVEKLLEDAARGRRDHETDGIPAMSDLPCGESADARYCETFWTQHAEIEELRTQLAADMDEIERLRELLDEIGVMAANAPEDGDSFGLLEEIAMRIAEPAGLRAEAGPCEPGSVDIGEGTVWEDVKAAPELAAAMAETRQLRDLAAEILAAFGPSGSGHTARVGQVQIRRWRERAGLEG